MARLIDADELIYGLKKEFGQFAMTYILAFIKAQPNVDPVKHGHWIEGCPTETTDYFNCSVCNAGIFVNNLWRVSYDDVSEIHRFCLNCGAKMDGDSK